MSVLTAREAYRLWAPTYANETAISALDDELAQELSPKVTGKRLLDAGCGIARRLAGLDAEFSIGIDASPEMLFAGSFPDVAAADLRALPFADASFDLVWCRLVLGHLPDAGPAYRELARVCRPEGHLLVSDFHVDAAAAGHSRSFRDEAGVVRQVEHYVRDAAAHICDADQAGFTVVGALDGRIGPSVEAFYARAGRRSLYERDRGLAVVASLLFVRR